MSEPPVTILTSRAGATATCHLCEWTAHTAHSPIAGPAAQRISAHWAEHFRLSHSGSQGGDR